MKTAFRSLIAILLACCMTALCACSGGKPADVPSDDVSRFSLTADKTTVAPGESVTVTFRLCDLKNVACFDVAFSATDNAVVKEIHEQDKGEFTVNTGETDNVVMLGAYVMTTCSIDDLSMLAITYQVAEDAAPGDNITVQADFSQMLVGTDESGDRTEDITDQCAVEPLVLTVA